MESLFQDLLFYAVCAWIAYVLLNDSSGGGKRDRVGASA
jgi:hypothetical protein